MSYSTRLLGLLCYLGCQTLSEDVTFDYILSVTSQEMFLQIILFPKRANYTFLARKAQLLQFTHLHKQNAGLQALLEGLQKVENRLIWVI